MGTHKSRRFANAFFLILWAIIPMGTPTIGFFYGLGHAIGNALWLLTICAATTLATVTKYGIGLDVSLSIGAVPRAREAGVGRRCVADRFLLKSESSPLALYHRSDARLFNMLGDPILIHSLLPRRGPSSSGQRPLLAVVD